MSTETKASSQENIISVSIHEDGLDLQTSAGPQLASTTTPSDPEAVEFHVVDFQENDPANPMNWPRMTKWNLVGLVSSLSFVANLATMMCAPPAPEILLHFKETNQIYVTLLVSIWELGEACGPLLIAPLSETYGRLPIYHTTSILFVVFSICCALSSNLNMLVAFRFLNGMTVAAITLNPSVVGDMFAQEERGGVLSMMMAPQLLSSLVAPVIGGYVGQFLGWRWVFWLAAIAEGICELAFIFFFRESYKVSILEKKASRLRKQNKDPLYQSIYASTSGASTSRLLLQALIRPIKMLIFSPIVLFISVYVAVVYGYAYLIMTTITTIFQEIYGFSEGTVGLMFIGQGLGMAAGLLLCRLVLDKHIRKQKSKPGGMKPEHRLPPMVLGGLVLPAGLFLYGWTAQAHLPWIVPVIGTSLLGFGLLLTTIPAFGYLVDAFPLYSASAVAASIITRCVTGSFLPLAGPALYAHLGVGWGNSLLGFTALVLIPVPILLMKYGERIRTSKRFMVVF